MSPRVLAAADVFWRPSNQMGVMNTDLAKQLESSTIAARLWRRTPGQASTKHGHVAQTALAEGAAGDGRGGSSGGEAVDVGQVVDELVWGDRVADDRFYRVRLLLGFERARVKHASPPEDRVERRAQLVTDRRQKLVLQAGRFLCFVS